MGQDVVQMVKQRMSHYSLDKNIHRDVYSIIIGILVLAGLIALMLYIVNPIQSVPDVRGGDPTRKKAE